MTKEDMLHIANRCGFHFHDAGYAPMLHTTEAKYSQKCFERMNTQENLTAEDIKELLEYENSQEFNDALIEEIEELAKWKKKYLD